MRRAKAHVAGTPITQPVAMAQPVDRTGPPAQLKISAAKNTFTPIPPADVKPSVKRQSETGRKTIRGIVQRRRTRFVPVKSEATLS